MMTVKLLRGAHEELLGLRRQLTENEANFGEGSYQKSREIFRKIDVKQDKISQYDELFAMSLADFAQDFCEACDYVGGIEVKLVAKSKLVSCQEFKNQSGTQLKNYLIPFEYGFNIRKSGDNKAGTCEYYVRVTDSRFSFVTNYADDAVEGEIEQIQDSALAPERLKNIKINLLTNRDLHIVNFRNTAPNCETGDLNMDELMWRAFSAHIAQTSRERTEEIAMKIDTLEEEHNSLVSWHSIDSLLRDGPKNDYSLVLDDGCGKMERS